jgi:isoquinoline 1-oxidoreductase beta subunit
MTRVAEKTARRVTRRRFLLTAAAVGGGLAIGLGGPKAVRRLAGGRRVVLDTTDPFRTWLEIDRAGAVTITIPNAEMGQGVTTALAMLVAEELDVEWRTVRTRGAPVNKIFRMPIGRQETGASMSVHARYDVMRTAGAAAREMLVSAAAELWGVPAAACAAAEGFVRHRPTGRAASYGELASRAARMPVPSSPALKSPRAFRVLGRSMPALDAWEVVTGRAGFGLDATAPGVVYAAVRRSPVFGGTVASYDDRDVKRRAGVKAVVPIPNGIAVVADTFWRAQSALNAMAIRFEGGESAELSIETVDRRLRRALDRRGVRLAGTSDEEPRASGRALTADYVAPFQAHMCMEPMNCLVSLTRERCDIWIGTQAPERAVGLAARMTGLPPDRVHLHEMRLGGGFGRRLEVDMVEQAVVIAKTVAAPVKVAWTREEDTRQGFYRAATAARFIANVDGSGRLGSLHVKIAGPSALRRAFPNAFEEVKGRDYTAGFGLARVPYAIPKLAVDYVNEEFGVPVGWMRGVSHTWNAWFLESFLDELAHAVRRDPLAFRESLLAPGSRHASLLLAAADRAGWRKPLPAGHARGLSLVELSHSVAAQVVELRRAAPDTFEIVRIHAVVDAGVVVHPDIARAQVEGGILYGLSGALREAVDFRGGAVAQSNFHDYPVLKPGEAPPIDVTFVTSGAAPGGLGEIGTVGIAPAICNALFALTSRRVRALPLAAQGWRMAPPRSAPYRSKNRT